MIQCPVCNLSNHHLTVICKGCGSYLQNKIENLDLFSTIWNILERPGKAFHNIAIATHKNYSYILSGISGIGFIFFIFWIINAGEYTNSLLNFLFAGISIGPPLGIITVLLYTFILIISTRLGGEKVTFRNGFAVVSYSLIPIVISIIFILPIEVMTFGLFFFSKNPSPYLLKPFSYVMLLVLDGIFLLWTFLLLWKGIKALTDRGWIFISAVQIITISILCGLYYAVINSVISEIG